MNKEQIIDTLNAMCKDTLMAHLDIQFIDVDIEKGMVKASMPVNAKVHQPMGLLHGGASAALAESLGSAGSCIYADVKDYNILGIEISCNHLRGIREGMVYATGTVIHKGRSTHLWEIRIEDEEGRLISHCKLTNMLVPKKK